jgi:hypothetical protein
MRKVFALAAAATLLCCTYYSGAVNPPPAQHCGTGPGCGKACDDFVAAVFFGKIFNSSGSFKIDDMTCYSCRDGGSVCTTPGNQQTCGILNVYSGPGCHGIATFVHGEDSPGCS